MKTCVVAIAKDEGRFIHEWLAHQLALGFDRVIVYDHQSTDSMPGFLDRVSLHEPVERMPWNRSSPSAS